MHACVFVRVSCTYCMVALNATFPRGVNAPRALAAETRHLSQNNGCIISIRKGEHGSCKTSMASACAYYPITATFETRMNRDAALQAIAQDTMML